MFQFILQILIGLLSPTAIITFIYYALLKYINETGWKKKYPEYDLSGTWADNTLYSKSFGVNTAVDEEIDNNEINESSSDVIMEQTCLSIKIKSSQDENYE